MLALNKTVIGILVSHLSPMELTVLKAQPSFFAGFVQGTLIQAHLNLKQKF